MSNDQAKDDKGTSSQALMSVDKKRPPEDETATVVPATEEETKKETASQNEAASISSIKQPSDDTKCKDVSIVTNENSIIAQENDMTHKLSDQPIPGAIKKDKEEEAKHMEFANVKKQSTESTGDNATTKHHPTTSSSSGTLPPRPMKRARTAYFLFAEDKRPQIQAEHPGEGVATVARIMGQLWANLSQEEKDAYQQKAVQERERLAQEMEEWKAAGGGVVDMSMDGSAAAGNSMSQKDPTALIFPSARIRKICKLDPEVRGLSKEALMLITKCTELATIKLGKEAVKVAQLQNRRKLLPEDVAQVCAHREQFLFLKDDVRDLVRDMGSKQEPKPNAAKKGDAAREAASVGTKPISSFFAVTKEKTQN